MNTKILGVLILILALGALGFAALRPTEAGPCDKEGKCDAFAQCLGEKEAIFYGAFWCPHCKNQKEMFGSAAKFLPYVECSTPDGRDQLQVCADVGIEGYPTWEFADGSRQGGEVALEVLSDKTQCPLP